MIEKIKKLLAKDTVIFGLLLFVGASIYANALTAPFIWDDLTLIVGNEQVKSFDHVKEWFTTGSSGGGDAASQSDLYRPMMKFIFTGIYTIFGENPIPFRALNIILHVLNSFFVFVLFKKMNLSRYGSLLAALFFLVHPVQVEAITYISGLPDVLAPFFILSGLIFFKSGKNFLALAACLLGLLSKEIAVTFFAFTWLLIAYEFKTYDKKTLSTKIKWAASFTVLTLIYVILKLTILNFTGSVHLTTLVSDYTESTWLRIVNFISTIWEYCKLIIFPKDLFFEKIYLPITELIHPRGIFGLAAIIAGGLMSYNSFLKDKKFFFAFSWFFIGLLPVSGILIIANTLYAERWLYLPLIAVAFGIAVYFEKFKNKKSQIIFACVLVAISIALGARTIYRNFDWTNPEKFYENEIAHNPYSPRVYSQLGTIHFAKGNYNRAVAAFEKSVMTDDIESTAIYRFNLGDSYYYLGKYDEAEYWLREALRLKPDYEKAKIILEKTIYDKNRFQ